MEISWPCPTVASPCVQPPKLTCRRSWITSAVRSARPTSPAVDTIQGSQTLIADRLSEPDSLLCAVVLDDRVVGDIGGRRYRPQSLGPDPDAWDFYLGYSSAAYSVFR